MGVLCTTVRTQSEAGGDLPRKNEFDLNCFNSATWFEQKCTQDIQPVKPSDFILCPIILIDYDVWEFRKI